MKGSRKWFDKDLYKQNDSIAKLNVIRIFKRVAGYTVEENEKKRGVDLLVYNKKGEHVFNLECEIKRVWKKKKFEYANVRFPERKEKFAKLKPPTIFLMFNHDQSAYLVVKPKDLLKSPKVESSNRFMRSGEYFFEVPLEKVVMNNIKTVIKELEEEYYGK